MDAKACTQYAADAVNAAQSLTQCYPPDRSDPFWSTNYDTHFRWCLSANDDSVNDQWQYRKQLMANCSFCLDYANKAVADAEKNIAESCGFTGPRWQTDLQGHLNWCLGDASAYGVQTTNEELARENQLATCVPLPPRSNGASGTPQPVVPSVPLNVHSPTYHGPKTTFTPSPTRHVLLSPCYPGGPPRLFGQTCRMPSNKVPLPNGGWHGNAGSCPSGTKGTPPNCTPVTTSSASKCPLGTYGTPPNCKKVAVGVKVTPGGASTPVIR